MMKRRNALKTVAVAPLLTSLNSYSNYEDAWVSAVRISESVEKETRKINRFVDLNIKQLGAVSCEVNDVIAWVRFEQKEIQKTPADNSFDNYEVIKQAIELCSKKGGGRVVIPAGNWYCAGPIEMLSNVNLHLESGAKVFFSNNPLDYAKYGKYKTENGNLTLSRWEGNDLLNYSPLIYAIGQENIQITAEDWSCVFNGQAGVNFKDSSDCWWSWKGRSQSAFYKDKAHILNSGKTEVHINPNNTVDVFGLNQGLTIAEARFIQGEGNNWRKDPHYLRAMAEAGVPAEKRVFGIGHYLRPHMIQLISCKNVKLEGYQTINSPFWQHNLVDCENVHINKVFANSRGPNSDGIDPESCRNVLMENCMFDTGDDCIAIDSGKGRDTQFGPAKNIYIRNCTMQGGHGGITIGSIMSAGVENIFVENIVLQNKNWDSYPLNVAVRIKSNMNRGGYVRDVHIRNIDIPNGVRTTPGWYVGRPESGIPKETVATTAGGVVTVECAYDPAADNVRTRPPKVSDIYISKLRVGKNQESSSRNTSYQAVVLLGPVAADYNGKGNIEEHIYPISNVHIEDSDFGNPVNADNPIYLYNSKDIYFKNVKISGQLINKKFESSK